MKVVALKFRKRHLFQNPEKKNTLQITEVLIFNRFKG